ncbi:MAG: Endonuclease/exonuclease/phosphatase [Bacteroidetes bacterium]|nr:Endonuclease/exonuclease/phosphatase [Bacteroidota bacterium]
MKRDWFIWTLRVVVLSFWIAIPGYSQLKDTGERFRVMSYNVENFLDYRQDSLVPSSSGLTGWSAIRYFQKRNNIAKVIVAVGGWEPPALVALCEVQNRRILDDLTLHSALWRLHYKISHFESSDPRGIDVALLYQPKRFHPYLEKPIRIRFADNVHRRTRDILYVAGTLRNGDTLHVFVNHFPSRLGGELESEDSRLEVAGILRRQVDSIFCINSQSNIIIMGDFNDYPDNKSVSGVLGALPDDAPVKEKMLYNLCYSTHKSGKIGSYKHASQWGMLDQIIVSAHLLDRKAPVAVCDTPARVFDAPFLLEDDVKGFGKQPFRTYLGPKYRGGFSDHLPVYLDIVFRKKSDF